MTRIIRIGILMMIIISQSEAATTKRIRQDKRPLRTEQLREHGPVDWIPAPRNHPPAAPWKSIDLSPKASPKALPTDYVEVAQVNERQSIAAEDELESRNVIQQPEAIDADTHVQTPSSRQSSNVMLDEDEKQFEQELRRRQFQVIASSQSNMTLKIDEGSLVANISTITSNMPQETSQLDNQHSPAHIIAQTVTSDQSIPITPIVDESDRENHVDAPSFESEILSRSPDVIADVHTVARTAAVDVKTDVQAPEKAEEPIVQHPDNKDLPDIPFVESDRKSEPSNLPTDAKAASVELNDKLAEIAPQSDEQTQESNPHNVKASSVESNNKLADVTREREDVKPVDQRDVVEHVDEREPVKPAEEPSVRSDEVYRSQVSETDHVEQADVTSPQSHQLDDIIESTTPQESRSDSSFSSVISFLFLVAICFVGVTRRNQITQLLTQTIDSTDVRLEEGVFNSHMSSETKPLMQTTHDDSLDSTSQADAPSDTIKAKPIVKSVSTPPAPTSAPASALASVLKAPLSRLGAVVLVDDAKVNKAIKKGSDDEDGWNDFDQWDD